MNKSGIFGPEEKPNLYICSEKQILIFDRENKRVDVCQPIQGEFGYIVCICVCYFEPYCLSS